MHLKKNGECAIYEERPVTCRQHSTEDCEYNGSIFESALQSFQSYKELDDYCTKKFKTWKKRF
jgi:Fe-S-cluster containining protein